MIHLAFLSYARRDAGPELDRFEADLRRAIAGRDLGFGARAALFRDQRSIDVGYDWSAALDHALATCQAFLPLISSELGESTFCGKEWAARAMRGLVPVPVVWGLPARGPFEGLPARILEVQLDTLGAQERRAGLGKRLAAEAEAGLLEEVRGVSAEGGEEPGPDPGPDPGPEPGDGGGDVLLGRRLAALEAHALHRKLVLLGDPGSGKSTFGRYLALCHAGALLGRAGPGDPNLDHLNRLPEGFGLDGEALAPWPHGVHLPILVELDAGGASSLFGLSSSSAGAAGG